MKYKSLIFILLFFVLSGCARIIEKPPAPAPVKPRPAKPAEIPPTPVKAQEALVRVDANTLPPIFSDVDKLPLEIAVLKSIGFYERSSGRSFRFGSETYSADHLRQSLLQIPGHPAGLRPARIKGKARQGKFPGVQVSGPPGQGHSPLHRIFRAGSERLADQDGIIQLADLHDPRRPHYRGPRQVPGQIPGREDSGPGGKAGPCPLLQEVRNRPGRPPRGQGPGNCLVCRPGRCLQSPHPGFGDDLLPGHETASR